MTIQVINLPFPQQLNSTIIIMKRGILELDSWDLYHEKGIVLKYIKKNKHNKFLLIVITNLLKALIFCSKTDI